MLIRLAKASHTPSRLEACDSRERHFLRTHLLRRTGDFKRDSASVGEAVDRELTTC